MTFRRLGSAVSVVLSLFLGGCSGSLGLYHSIEGGAIAQNRQPPPGADQPYPNLADVPEAPPPTPPGAQAAIAARAHANSPGISPPSPGALAGLELPAAPPPLPKIPGLNLTQPPAAAPTSPTPAAPPPNGPPVALAFPPGSAILPAADLAPISAIAAARVRAIAAARGKAQILAGGFGESFALALARAQRLGEALTAAGVPAADIKLLAQPAGSGGFVQLVY